jgi:hypothetical protein
VKCPRFLHWLYAHLFAYFWLPCPICEEMFGGHEARWALMDTLSSGHAVCPNCVEGANERNEEKFGGEMCMVSRIRGVTR